MINEKKYHLYSYVYIFLLITIVSFLILPTLQYVRFAEKADEGYYFRYANIIADKGLIGFRQLFTEYLGNRQDWVFPNPLRMGFIFIAAIFCKIFGRSFLALAYLSFFSYLIFIFINYYFCRRLFDTEKAALFSFLIAFSPLNLAMSRRALPDSTATLLLGLSIWLFLDMIYKDRRTIKKILFVLAFSFSVLTKETCIILAVPFFIFTLVYKTRHKEKLFGTDFMYIFVYPVILLLVIYFLVTGNLFRVIETVNAVSLAVKSNQYAVLFGSGPWFRYIIDFLLLSPWIVIFSIGFLFYYIVRQDYNEPSLYFLLIFILTFFLFTFFTKNVRYVMILDLPMRLFSVLMLRDIIARFFPKQNIILVITCIILIAIFDYVNFYYLFLHGGIYDPISFWLLKAKQIIP